jgi:cytochrome b6-f complex iron-sulfur subunit/menaquinol-cytochrome c reductase iron-sulfur subunit
MKVLALAGGTIGCGALAIPVGRFLVAPAAHAGGAGRWIRTVALEALRDGEPKRVALVADHRDAWTLEKSVELGAVWLVRKGTSVLAWSVTCPHLGCSVDRASSGKGFYCACHDSSFDPSGKRETGPSPRDLDSLATRVETDGTVSVEFRRFRQGIADKTPV